MDKDCSTRKRDNYWFTYPASLFTALEVPSDPAKVVVMVIADSLGHLRLNLAITKLFRSDTIPSFGSVSQLVKRLSISTVTSFDLFVSLAVTHLLWFFVFEIVDVEIEGAGD